MANPGRGSRARLQRYVSVREVATAFSIHPNTVWKWIRTGVLSSVRIATVVRIPREAVDALVARR